MSLLRIPQTNRRISRRISIAAALFVCGPMVGSAQALGGSAVSESPGWLDSRTVMVLGNRGSVCTGAVVSPTVIITAAHCVTGSGQYAVAYKDAGSTTLQEVRQVARHPDFKTSARVSTDMALVRLRLPLPSRFSPVTLDGDAEDDGVGSRQIIAGFGLAREGDDKSAGTLRSAEVTVLPRYYPRFFRLGIADGGLLICKGDSGGPVFSAGLISSKLTGVIYASERQNRQCGDTAQAVRVAPQRKWIDKVRAGWGE
jgi:secreted trypsin-like serine protease